MGRKHTGNRQYFLFYFICFLITLFLTTACRHLPSMGEQHLLTAKALLANGNNKAALSEAEQVLELYPKEQGDKALHLMGVLFIHPKSPKQDLNQSIEKFQSLTVRYPDSELLQEAKAWIEILKKIQHKDKEIINLKENVLYLESQIEDLKKIDLKIEEKKRGQMP